MDNSINVQTLIVHIIGAGLLFLAVLLGIKADLSTLTRFLIAVPIACLGSGLLCIRRIKF